VTASRVPNTTRCVTRTRRRRHPARLGDWPCGLTALRLHPVAKGPQDRRQVIGVPISEAEGQSVRGQHLSDLMPAALGQRQGTFPDLDGQQERADEIDGRPHPLRCALQAPGSFGLRDRALRDRAEQGIECSELHRGALHMRKEALSKGLELVGGLNEPGQDGIGLHREETATARMPRPAARVPMAHTSSGGERRWPCESVSWVSKKSRPQAVQGSWCHALPLGWPLAPPVPRPTQPWETQRGWGQKWNEVATTRRRPRVEIICGGGAEGDDTTGVLRACPQSAPGGLWRRPGNGLGSGEPLWAGVDGGGPPASRPSRQRDEGRRKQSHRSTKRTSASTSRSDPIAKPPHPSDERAMLPGLSLEGITRTLEGHDPEYCDTPGTERREQQGTQSTPKHQRSPFYSTRYTIRQRWRCAQRFSSPSR
jgi:hypothetical protein